MNDIMMLDNRVKDSNITCRRDVFNGSVFQLPTRDGDGSLEKQKTITSATCQCFYFYSE